jgi:hypothetical protein
MRVSAIIALTILCSAVLAAAPSKVDICMYDKVSRMSDEGQKLAFFLTRTAIKTEVTSSTEVTYSTHVHTQYHTKYISSFVNSEEWVESHGGWTTVCSQIAQKCENKRGKTVCKKWKKSCDAHSSGFNWTVGPNVVVNGSGNGSSSTTGNGNGSSSTTTGNGSSSTSTTGNGKTGTSTTTTGTGSGKPTKGKKCTLYAAAPRKRVCVQRNKSNKCTKRVTFYRSNKCTQWKKVLRSYIKPNRYSFKRSTYLRILRGNKDKKWRRAFRRAVRRMARKYKLIRVRRVFFKAEKKYRICRKKMAALAKTSKWIVKMTKLNDKRRVKLAAKLNKINAIKDVKIRDAKLAKFKIYRKKSKKNFKRKVSLKLAKGCGCEKKFLKFNKYRKSLRLSLKVKKAKGRKLQCARAAASKKITVVRRPVKKVKVVKAKVAKAKLSLKIKAPKTKIVIKKGLPKKNKIVIKKGLPKKNKIVIKINKPVKAAKIVVDYALVSKCFRFVMGHPYIKQNKKCVKSIRTWAATNKKFRCVTRERHFTARRCLTFKQTKKGKVVCTKRVKIYGTRVCIKRGMKNGRVRCLGKKTVFPKARCVKSVKVGKKSFCVQNKFYRPITFCAKYKKFSGKRRCVAKKTFAGKKFFKVRCAKTKKIIKVAKGKKCGCNKFKVVLRKKFRVNAKKFKMRCQVCAEHKKRRQLRLKFNKKMALKFRAKKAALKLKVRKTGLKVKTCSKKFVKVVKAPSLPPKRILKINMKKEIKVGRKLKKELKKIAKNKELTKAQKIAKRVAAVEKWWASIKSEAER